MTWRRYIAIGDSFTEGLDDRVPTGYRGWADRLAARLGERQPDALYANLAVRGRKLPDIVQRQLPLALAQRPDLVSMAGGINDALRPSWDVSQTANLLERAVISTRETGADVILFAFGPLGYRSKILGLADRRIAEFHELTVAIAEAHECYLVDFAPERLFDDDRFWAQDRLHLNSLGHERVAMIVTEVLGLGKTEWDAPLPAAPARSIAAALTADARWTAQHLAPWVGRRLQRRSSGDDVTAKRPALLPVRTENPVHS